MKWKEWLNILEKVFAAKQTPSFSHIETEISDARNRKKQELPFIASENKMAYNRKYKTNYQRIEVLKFDYSYHYLVHELLIDTIDALTNNPSFANQLFRTPAEYNVKTINDYLNTYANIKLEKVTIIEAR